MKAESIVFILRLECQEIITNSINDLLYFWFELIAQTESRSYTNAVALESGAYGFI